MLKVEAISSHVSEMFKYNQGVRCRVRFVAKLPLHQTTQTMKTMQLFKGDFKLEGDVSPALTPRTTLVKTQAKHDTYEVEVNSHHFHRH